ncbi:MAG TPA: hypothetical protein PLG60_00945 [Acidimicrobiales bacterium]|nr:MAG: hypothetical protein B7X07_00370 [Actinobacteria bacterium 21-64-8]HQT99050.1 hypothetical protein [Acidimicrobiales bacterium]
MTSSSICVVGSDPTMVADTLHNVIATALGDVDPSFALEDFSLTDGDDVVARVVAALNTPPFLVERRVIVVRDAQQLSVEDAAPLLAWMSAPTSSIVLVLGVVGAKSHRLVKAAHDVVEVNVGSRASDRVAFVRDKLAEYRVTMDAATSQKVADQVGDDVSRVDALARTLASIFGSAPLSFKHLEPYLGDAGDVPVWDLTDAIDAGDVTKAITVARRMLDSRARAGLQIIAMLQRHFLNIARLEGSGANSKEEAATLLGINAFPAGKALATARRLGAARVATAVHWLSEADLALKGGVSYGGRDLVNDQDVTELTVLEVLVARLARLNYAARRS